MKKQTILANVIMLPTDKPSNIVRNLYKFTPEHGGPLEVIKEPISNAQDRGYEYQHLYFTTDEKTKQGDIAYDPAMNSWGINGNSWNPNNKKIVATTNSEIWYKGEFNEALQRKTFGDVPKIDNEFIQSYIDAYNSGKPIEKVLLEKNTPVCQCDTIDKIIKCPYACNGGEDCNAPNPNDDFYGLRLKLNSDGSVVIHPIISIKEQFKKDMIGAYCKRFEDSKGKVPISIVLDAIDWFDKNY